MGRRLATCLLIVLVAGGWLVAGINRWTTSGPYGGQILFLTVDPQTPNVVYAGVLYGGFFRSLNWGQSWEAYSGFASPVFSCTVHPTDHNIVLASSYEAVFRSTDAGDSWSQVGSTGRMRDFAIPTTRLDTVYAGGMNGFWRSTDRGQTWAKTASLSGIQIDNVSLPPGLPDTVYLGTWNAGILRSTDGGFSWSPIFSPSGLGYRVACHPDRPGWIYASVYDPAGIYRSTNGGTSWTQLSSNKYFEEMEFDPVDPNRIYFIGLYGSYLSTDGGQTSTTVCPLGGRAVALDRSSADGALYLGTLSGVQRSWDGGGTFRSASAGILSYIWALAVSPTVPGTVYAGDDTSNLFRSRDSGESWEPLSDVTDWPSMETGLVTTILGEQWSYLAMGFKGLALTSATSPPTLFGTVNGDLYRSTNEGTSWSLALANKILWDVRTDPTNPLRLYASSGWVGWTYSFTGIHRSTNGGANWTATGQLLNTNISELLVDPQTPQTLYAAGDSGLYKSTDSGGGWGSIASGLGDAHVYSLALDASNPSFLFAGTGDAGIYRSSNGGSNWTYSGLSGGRIYALGCETASNAVYAGKWPGLYESTNSGSTWGPSSPDLAESNVRDVATDSRGAQRVYTATTAGVFARTGTTAPTVEVQVRTTQSGSVNMNLANQVLPATALTLLFAENNYPSASASTPVILELQLPAGAVLGQTLATAELADTAIQPTERIVIPLAVSEYAYDAASATFEPVAGGGSTAGIGANAVQLFRCVAGEDRIWLRLTQSTSAWHPSSAERLLGITIGAGAGVWPPTAGSNWAASGQFRQENTQFFGDLRGYDFAAQQGALPVSLRAFYQKTGVTLSTGFSQNPVNLFRLDLDRDDEYANNVLYGAVVTDSAVADLDGDGQEDLVSIDRDLRRVYWALRQADGNFGAPEWRALAGDAPVTVDTADVNGDGRPEVLVSDAGGHLTVYSWASLSAKIQSPDEVLAPLLVATLAGTASASLVADVNNDGNKDFLYTDSAANTFNILYGLSFNTSTSLTTGGGPAALAVGDVDGDTDLDVAVANRTGNSVTLFRNQGGSFSTATYTAGGQPAAVAMADFGRDGRADLAIALADKKALAAWTARSDGTFNPGQAQTIYFQNPPSALAADNFDGVNGADVLAGFADFYKLALCTSDAAGSLGYAYAINTLGDVELDPVNHVTLTEDNVLSIAGGTSYGGVCSRTGVAAVAEQPFNLVHLPRSLNLSFSVVNLGTQTALLSLELYNNSGGLVRSVSQSVAPGQQYARYLTDPSLFGSDAANPQRWVRGFVTEADTYGFWLANDGASLDYLDGLPLADIRNARSRFLLPAGMDTLRQVLLVNPYQDQAQVTVQRFGGGTLKQTLSFLVAGRGRRLLDLPVDMPALAAEDYLLVSADRPVIGCQLWGDAHRLAALDGLPVPEAPATLYCPHVAAGNLGVQYETFLTLVNPSDQGTVVIMRLYNDAGILESTTPLITIPARSKRVDDVQPLFGAFNAFTGYVVVEVQGPGVVAGDITIGEAGAGRFLSSLPLSAGGAADYLVGHIANGTLGTLAFFTGLAVVNPHLTAHSVRITAFNQNGQPIGSTTDSVSARGREVFLLDQKMPGLTSIFGGYLHIEDLTDPAGQLCVFALFGDQPLNFLSAVAAQPVRQ